MEALESITQKDDFGCGIACVAFICNVSYDHAKNRYFKFPEDAESIGFYCRDLVYSLSKAEKNYKYKYHKRKMQWKEGMIIYIKRSKKHPAGHYLVRTKNGWMDPWINFDRLNEKTNNVKNARSGFRQRLPGTPQYVIYPV